MLFACITSEGQAINLPPATSVTSGNGECFSCFIAQQYPEGTQLSGEVSHGVGEVFIVTDKKSVCDFGKAVAKYQITLAGLMECL